MPILPPKRRTMLRLRRNSWPYFLVPVLFLFLIFHGVPPSVPPESESGGVLHPGDYVDASRRRDMRLESLDEPVPFLIEPNGVGSLRDLRNEKFYLGGTLQLTSQDPGSPHPQPQVYDPYPAYNTRQWHKQWKGHFNPCRGPRGVDLDRTKSSDMISAYRGNQREFPFPMFGSYEALDMDANVCYDRYSRYGPYGYDEDGYEDVPGFQRPPKVCWDEVNWGILQSQCYDRNADRYNPNQINQRYTQHILSLDAPPAMPWIDARPSWRKSYKQRSAVVLRASNMMSWTQSHRQYLRSLIMELSLHTGSEYQVFFMVDVKDEELKIETDERAVDRVKEQSVPAEFRNMTVLFNSHMLEKWYPKIEEHVAVYQHLQPMQLFAQLYPEFNFYWQMEFDARIIGHNYHFLEQAIEFARKQPRKYLWERNAYFYIPGAHGPYEDFAQNVANSLAGRHTVWGPTPVPGITPAGPKPPVDSPEKDNFEWGVGEEADLITFLPIFDPRRTFWTFPNVLWNIGQDTPRRASVITQWRMSKRLLDIMHQSQMKDGIGFVSEMSAPSFALLHGFKAVSIPHPIYADGKWTPHELARIYNPGPPELVNGDENSVWNWDHRVDTIMYRLSYMFTTQTAEDLMRRWLGYKPNPDQYTDGSPHEDSQGRFWYDGGSINEPVYGRLCFPAVWLHTVKNFEPEFGPDMAVPV